MTAPALPPVVAIDGPSASGKGTVAQLCAAALGFHFLDSGAIYRAVALVALDRAADLDNTSTIEAIALNLNVEFVEDEIVVQGEEVSARLRSEEVGVAASRISAYPTVRQALLDRQKGFRRPPGLVADGRDMGSVVFPDAAVKIFLTASPEERARRRYKQLIEKGMSASMSALLQDIRDRDARDSARAVSPLQKCSDAIEIDSTGKSVDQIVALVLAAYRRATGP